MRGSVSAFAVASIFRGYLQIFTGELAEAETDLQNGLRASEQHGLMTGVAYALAFLADAQMQRGDLEAAAATLAKLGALPEAARDHWYYFDARGRLRHLQGRYREALAEFDATQRQFEAVGGKNPARWSPGDRRPRSRTPPRRARRGAQARLEEVEVARQWGAPRALAKALRVQGMVQGGKESLPLLSGRPSTSWTARARRSSGRAACSSSGRRSGGRTSGPRRGSTCARRSSWRTPASRRRSRSGADRADGQRRRPRRIALSGLESLTPSERRVAAMAAKEMTNRDIAQALFVTPKTVEVHLSSVYRKLGIASRAQLADVLGAVEESGLEAPAAPALG